ncbi:hypothetical protein [Luethyella okanaganae]|uniref:Uncharacterized protein n=1 Tax=Luethyella okanaganae TaxID=69372 RepID=A0ABW1VG00_9MICO
MVRADACAGTITYYKNGVRQKSVNILAYQASQPTNRSGAALDAWCSAHSFQCNGLYLLAGVALSILFGALNS